MQQRIQTYITATIVAVCVAASFSCVHSAPCDGNFNVGSTSTYNLDLWKEMFAPHQAPILFLFLTQTPVEQLFHTLNYVVCTGNDSNQ
jgi:hypothetical protein